MIELTLTDWDDYIIRRAILMNTYINLKRSPGQLNNNQKAVVKAYWDAYHNHHHVEWPVYGVKQSRYYVFVLRNREELACRHSTTRYFNPHYYEPVINKLNHALYKVPKKVEAEA